MRSDLNEIIINDIHIRSRDNQEFKDWISGINSVLFPKSLKCAAMRGADWENCILTGKLSDDASGRLMVTVVFDDATVVKTSRSKQSLLQENDSSNE